MESGWRKNRKAERITQTLTGRWEKRVLLKMARALPQWVKPDHLTALGVLAGIAIFVGLLLVRSSRWWIMLSNAGFVIHWWADSLDGTLARIRHREREAFGYFVDHISDAFTTILFALGLALSSLVNFGVGISVAIGYLLINVYAYVEAYIDQIFRISYIRLGPTEIRIICAAATTLGAFWNPRILSALGIDFRLVDVLALSADVGLVIVFIVFSIRTALRLDRLDRAKWTKEGS